MSEPVWDMYFRTKCGHTNPGVCQSTFSPGETSMHRDVKLTMTTLGIRVIILFLLLRFLYMTRKAAEDGQERFQRVSIFPVHRSLLKYIASLLVVTCVLKSWKTFASMANDAPSQDDMHEHKFFLMGAFSQGLHHAISEGMVVLFVSPGCGKKTLRRVGKFGTVWFFIVTGIYSYCNWEETTDDRQVLLMALPLFLAIVYGILWLLPQFYALVIVTIQGALFQITRGAIIQDRGAIVPRPAARIYACFWCIAYSIEALSSILLFGCLDSGFCVEFLVYIIFHVVLFTPVTYWCFLLEAQWWCEVTDSLAAHRHRPCETGLTICLDLCHVPLKCCKSCDNGSALSDRWHSGDSGRTSATFDEQEDINNPLSGIPWNSSVGQNAAEAIDDLGNFRQRGSSMVMHESELPSLDVESGKIPTSSKKPSHNTREKLINPPLLNFTRVKILRNHLLGAGSSARVYEGRWCDQHCAIKVLFSMDLKKAEILRCIEEAKLLHSLNDPHVLKMVGVSVQPPSLCLVLELCSAGSLSDVLYKEEYPQEKEGTSTVDSVRKTAGNSGGSNVFDRATSSTGSRDRISSTGGSPAISGMESTGTHCSMERGRYEYDLDAAYLTRIDLALGAAKGVAAVHAFHKDMDERYSHNDIKSANFLCNWTDPVDGYRKIEVKIADVEFASKEKQKQMWETSPGAMTANWAAPELHAYPSPKPVAQVTDVFSLGAVLYEITMRQVPFATFPDTKVREKYQADERPHLPRIFPAPTSRRVSNAAGLSKPELFDRALERQENHARHVENSGDGEATEYADRISVSSVNSFESPSGGSVDATSDGSMVEEAKQHLRNLNPTQASENLARLLAYESTVALINQCWSQDPSERLSASDLVESLEKVRAAYATVSRRCSAYSRHGGGRDAGQDATGRSVTPSLSRDTSQDRPTDLARHARKMSDEARASRAASALATAPETTQAPAAGSQTPSLISNLDPPV